MVLMTLEMFRSPEDNYCLFRPGHLDLRSTRRCCEVAGNNLNLLYLPIGWPGTKKYLSKKKLSRLST